MVMLGGEGQCMVRAARQDGSQMSRGGRSMQQRLEFLDDVVHLFLLEERINKVLPLQTYINNA